MMLLVVGIAIVAFILPLGLRKYFIATQSIIAFIWIIVIFNILNNQSIESDLNVILLIALPMWIFGSLIALDIRSKNNSANETIYHEKAYHHNKK